MPKQTCQAMTRKGTPCMCKPLKRGGRCRFHGGMSTGPKTPEGRERSRRNLALAQAALAGPEHAETRRQRSLAGWRTRRAKLGGARFPETVLTQTP